MSKMEKVIFWAALGALGFWLLKKQRGGTADGSGGGVGGGRSGRSDQPYRLGSGSLGRAEAYGDAFPEEGLGGIDPGR